MVNESRQTPNAFVVMCVLGCPFHGPIDIDELLITRLCWRCVLCVVDGVLSPDDHTVPYYSPKVSKPARSIG